MLIAGVVDDQFDHHLHVALMSRVKERLEVVQRSVRRIDIHVVGDVVAIIAQRRRKKRQEPDARDTQVLQIIEARHQAREIADAVVVRVGKGAHVQLVDDRVFVPEWVGCAGELLQFQFSELIWMRTICSQREASGCPGFVRRGL